MSSASKSFFSSHSFIRDNYFKYLAIKLCFCLENRMARHIHTRLHLTRSWVRIELEAQCREERLMRVYLVVYK